MNKSRFHWSFWVGVGFVIASLISFGVVLGGEGPPGLVEELFGYTVGWTVVGFALIAFSFLKNIVKK